MDSATDLRWKRPVATPTLPHTREILAGPPYPSASPRPVCTSTRTSSGPTSAPSTHPVSILSDKPTVQVFNLEQSQRGEVFTPTLYFCPYTHFFCVSVGPFHSQMIVSKEIGLDADSGAPEDPVETRETFQWTETGPH